MPFALVSLFANAVLTALLVALLSRSRRAAFCFAAVVPVAIAIALLAAHVFALGHNFASLLLASSLIALLVWVPGAALAVVSAFLRPPVRLMAGLVAIATGGFLGWLLTPIGLSVVCSVLGDCL